MVTVWAVVGEHKATCELVLQVFGHIPVGKAEDDTGGTGEFF